ALEHARLDFAQQEIRARRLLRAPRELATDRRRIYVRWAKHAFQYRRRSNPMRDMSLSKPTPLWQAPGALRACLRRLALLADAWLPATCVVCGCEDASGLCAGCLHDLPGAASARCARCGIRLAAPAAGCASCIAPVAAFARTIVLADYAAPLDRVVHALRFGRDASIAGPLGRALARRAEAAIAGLRAQALAADAALVVTAVPLSTKR